MDHPGNLALHPQRKEKQQRTRETLHHEHPRVCPLSLRLTAERQAISILHLPHRIPHPYEAKQHHESRHHRKATTYLPCIAQHITLIPQPLFAHRCQQQPEEHHRQHLSKHPFGILRI